MITFNDNANDNKLLTPKLTITIMLTIEKALSLVGGKATMRAGSYFFCMKWIT